MATLKTRYKAWLSVLLSLALAGTFTLSSFAASESTATDVEISDSFLVSQALTGALTTHGPVLVNGSEAKTGATITDGNLIQTRTGGRAMIELGATGRVDMDPITAITLSWTANSIQASLHTCGQGVTLVLPAGVSGLVKILRIPEVGLLDGRQVDVRVFKGEAVVKYGQGKEKIVKAGDHKEFDNATEVTSTGDAIVKVYCIEDYYPLLLFASLGALAIPFSTGEAVPVVSPLTP